MNESSPPYGDPQVFIVEHQPFDYSAAETFGRLVVLKADKLAPNAPDDAHNIRIVNDLRRQLSTYMPGVDYVIPTGMPTRIMLVGLLMRERGVATNRNTHNILGWDARTGRYLNYKVVL